MTAFRRAVEAAAAPVNEAWRPRLQALQGDHRRKVSCADAGRLTGSIDLDAALRPVPRYANAPRWDYGVGYRPPSGAERAVWIEVHKAETGEVTPVLAKLQQLRDWLTREGGDLRRMTDRGDTDKRYFWLATDNIRIPRNSPQRRKLNQRGLTLVPGVSLD